MNIKTKDKMKSENESNGDERPELATESYSGVVEYRVPFEEALSWELSKTSLAAHLVDIAEGGLEWCLPGFVDVEVEDTKIEVGGGYFIIRFLLPNAKAWLGARQETNDNE